MVRTPDWEPSFEDPEIQKYIFDVAGEPGLEVFKFILDNEPVSGEDITEHFAEHKPSGVRKVLYKLMESHALEYHKDTDTKGWETFTWATDLPEVRLIHFRQWEQEAKDLQKALKVEEDHAFYACANLHDRIMFEDAMDMDFHCPTCEAPMEPIANDDDIARIKERLDGLAMALQD